MSGFGPPQNSSSSGDGTIEIQDEGVVEGNVTAVNFTGAGSSVIVTGDTATVTVPGSSSGGTGYSYFPSGW